MLNLDRLFGLFENKVIHWPQIEKINLKIRHRVNVKATSVLHHQSISLHCCTECDIEAYLGLQGEACLPVCVCGLVTTDEDMT